MNTIKIDVSDTLYDKVMLFLENLPKDDIRLHDMQIKKQNNLTKFFQNSPLQDISIEREKEAYTDRVNF